MDRGLLGWWRLRTFFFFAVADAALRQPLRGPSSSAAVAAQVGLSLSAGSAINVWGKINMITASFLAFLCT